ncbi:MAG TPA: phosphoribosyl-AMP cyclohydrolase, partial [bacterium]|nr:phosphoribosyl-AMP cyclohydrolase [bacterium]
MSWIDTLKFQEDGLIPVIAQDHKTGEILMFAFANREALEYTAQTGNVTYWSRSR